MSEDWKRAHAEASEEAIDHPLVVAVMRELLENLGLSPDVGLPRYGVRKVALHAAQVARAQALGFDPDLLRHTPDEARSAQLRLAAQAVFDGVPVVCLDDYMVDPDGAE